MARVIFKKLVSVLFFRLLRRSNWFQSLLHTCNFEIQISEKFVIKFQENLSPCFLLVITMYYWCAQIWSLMQSFWRSWEALLKPRAQLTHSTCLTDAWRDKSTAAEIVEVPNYVMPNFALLTTLYGFMVKILHAFQWLILEPLVMHSKGWKSWTEIKNLPYGCLWMFNHSITADGNTRREGNAFILDICIFAVLTTLCWNSGIIRAWRHEEERAHVLV